MPRQFRAAAAAAPQPAAPVLKLSQGSTWYKTSLQLLWVSCPSSVLPQLCGGAEKSLALRSTAQQQLNITVTHIVFLLKPQHGIIPDTMKEINSVPVENRTINK